MSSKIIKLTVQNLLRIQAAEIKPDGALVIVAGRNDQGKSSLLNCIAIALSGKNLPAKPIREGATTGQVILETEQFVITRKFSQSGGGQLIVQDKEGGMVTAPQTKLDALYSLTTFDPLTFVRQKPPEQAGTLRQLTGLDFSDLQAEYDRLFSARTEVGRQVKMQTGKLTGIPRNPEVPEQPIDVAALAEELQEAIQHNAQIDRDQELLSTINDRIDGIQYTVDNVKAEIARLETTLERHKKELAAEIQMRDRQKANVAKAQPIEVVTIQARMSAVEATNLAIRENARWNDAKRELTELESDYAAKTARLAELQQEKAKRTAAAKFPVEGLGFDQTGTGVTFEGHPLEQVSSSKQIRVSLAIACALNPNLRVMLIRDGSLLDSDSLELVRKYAEQHDAQVFMECVGNREDATVIIEDGNVAATPAADAKAKATKPKAGKPS